jgi:hypothetical protein
VSLAVGVLLGGIDETGFDGVLNDIVTMLEKALPIPYPHLGKPTLPDLSLISKFLF